MAAECSCRLLIWVVSLLAVCSPGMLVVVGYSFHGQGVSGIPSEVRTVEFCKTVEDDIPVCGSWDYLFLSETAVENLVLAGALSLRSSNIPYMLHTRIDGIVLDFGKRSGDLLELQKILSAVGSVHGALGAARVEDGDHSIKLSVVFSLAFLEKLCRVYGRDNLHSLCNAFENALRMVIVDVDNLGRGDMASSLVNRAISVVPPDKFVLAVFIRRPTPLGSWDAAKSARTVSKYLQSSSHSGIYVAKLLADATGMDLHKRGRKLLDATATSTMPTTPIQAIPLTTSDTSTPTIVTVPGTTPVTVTPNIPSTTPSTLPSTTPVVYPPSNPITAPVSIPAATPITVPGAGALPVTNPLTTYPSPPVSTVPVTTPVTNPVGPPAVTNAPAIPGQGWCVARAGVTDAALQVAIDYACGIGGADCSQIQEGAGCYIPNTLQNHASYAFNSYYQRNPVATSCDFGGTAVIVNSNPTVGSCVYPNTASVATPATVATPSTSTTSSSPYPTGVAPLISSGTPPAVVNPVTGAPLGFMTESPQAMNTSTSRSVALVPGYHILILSSLVAAKFVWVR
ncbi:hypothetical protein MLD38_027461 [Melastoma candidum]|uniref:Uncharacterized protein n=1 Tax=Melastoma candidum TaxID=119954 RepID=A0ACB9P3M4_9MYRT|nr:hypothetical protein MLD38_027461 [Melastoma candidum]